MCQEMCVNHVYLSYDLCTNFNEQNENKIHNIIAYLVKIPVKTE